LGRSQHNTGVDDGIEDRGPEGEVAGAGVDAPRPRFEVLGGDAILGDGQSFEREIGEQHRASGRRRQVEAGPAAAGADVEQQVTPTQAEPFGELVGLGDRRVTVRTPVTADDALLDFAHDVDALLR